MCSVLSRGYQRWAVQCPDDFVFKHILAGIGNFSVLNLIKYFQYWGDSKKNLPIKSGSCITTAASWYVPATKKNHILKV